MKQHKIRNDIVRIRDRRSRKKAERMNIIMQWSIEKGRAGQKNRMADDLPKRKYLKGGWDF
jgi:hypothetical protein